MKPILKRAILLFLGIIASVELFAQTADTTQQIKGNTISQSAIGQFQAWSIGVTGGISSTYIIGTDIRKQDFTSPDPQSGYGIYVKRQLSRSFGLQADFMAGKLQADHSQEKFPNGAYIYSQFDTKINWAASLSINFIPVHIGFIQPYITLGGGMVSYTPVLQPYRSAAITLSSSSAIFIPAGAGLKFSITRSLNFDMGYQVNFVSSDNVDGYVYGGNNDKFSYAHAGFEFVFGNHLKAQTANHNSKTVEPKPLPTVQAVTPPLPIQQAVPDSEKVRYERRKKELDSTNAVKLTQLTVDSDGDGVPDVKDKCPNTPAGTKVDSTGCPIPVVVIKPEEKIVITDQDKRTIKIATQNLEFFPGTSIIHGYSFNGLDIVAELLITKGYNLKLEGHTDNTGKPTDNYKLSLERAEAVKSYLVGRGVNAAHIETVGFGAARPIASNKTEEGRRLNRRVEFTLLLNNEIK